MIKFPWFRSILKQYSLAVKRLRIIKRVTLWHLLREQARTPVPFYTQASKRQPWWPSPCRVSRSCTGARQTRTHRTRATSQPRPATHGLEDRGRRRWPDAARPAARNRRWWPRGTSVWTCCEQTRENGHVGTGWDIRHLGWIRGQGGHPTRAVSP